MRFALLVGLPVRVALVALGTLAIGVGFGMATLLVLVLDPRGLRAHLYESPGGLRDVIEHYAGMWHWALVGERRQERRTREGQREV